MVAATGPSMGAGGDRLPASLQSRWFVTSAALPPLAWLVHIAVMPALVPLSCRWDGMWPLHVATAVTLVAAAVGLVGSHRTRSEAHRGRADRGEPLEAVDEELLRRARVWSTWGVVTGWLFTVLIVAEHVPVFVLSACPP